MRAELSGASAGPCPYVLTACSLLCARSGSSCWVRAQSPAGLSGVQEGCSSAVPTLGSRPPLASLSAGVALVCSGVTVPTPASLVFPPACRLPVLTPPLCVCPSPPCLAPTFLLQPLGPSSSASSSLPGRAAWASTWPQRTRSSSTTRTGIHTMTSRSVALTLSPRGLLGAPVSWASPSPHLAVS